MAETMFLDGNCYSFAIALHHGLGLPILGLFTGEYQGPRHAVVSDGSLYDVRGKFAVGDPEFGKPFGATVPYDLSVVTEDELRKVRPISDRVILLAERMAQVLRPEYAWRGGPAKRAMDFANELEALCRKHKMWFIPVGAMPVVFKETDSEYNDDVKGFLVRPTEDGLGYTLTRYTFDDPT